MDTSTVIDTVVTFELCLTEYLARFSAIFGWKWFRDLYFFKPEAVISTKHVLIQLIVNPWFWIRDLSGSMFKSKFLFSEFDDDIPINLNLHGQSSKNRISMKIKIVIYREIETIFPNFVLIPPVGIMIFRKHDFSR